MTESDAMTTYPGLQRTTPHSPVRLLLTVPILILTLVAAILFSGWVFLQRTGRLYRGHIYPHVYALGIDLGGKTPAEAADALKTIAPQLDTGLLILTDGEARWSYPWSEAGLTLNAETTAQAAYAIGRGGTWQDQAEVWLNYYDVPPRFEFDSAAARDLLESLSEEVSVPAVDPEIRIEGDEVVLVPGEPGRVLDVATSLNRLQSVGGTPYRVQVELAFRTVEPVPLKDADAVIAEADALLARSLTVHAYDILTEEAFAWTLDRDEIGDWLYLKPGEGGRPTVDLNLYAIQETLKQLAESMGGGRGFRYEEAARQVLTAFDNGTPDLALYLTHPERTYAVQPGDTLTSLSAKFGMPPGLVAEANREIDIDKLSVGQEIRIPSQDILTPYLPVRDKKVVVSLDEQRVRVYENGALLYDWPVSTGIKESPTHRGTFQVLDKVDEAYASQWDLWMPYFISVYVAGGGVENGFHELPILAGGNRLWEGSLGSPASYGCIILGIPEAQTLYEWAEVGVVVEIR
jgi:lipoprotein-anchoring transpeptidase ErfK/SrfK